MNYRIFLSPPAQNGTEAKALQDVVASNWLAPVGPMLNAFETSLSMLHENRPLLAVNSGTAAIHLALLLCGVGKDDEVLVASHTHNATVNPIIYQNATPIFVDAENETWNISPKFLKEAIAARINLGKKPKALIIVHLYGLAADLDEILAIAQAYEIPIIEDAAESLGSTFHSRPLGTFGTFGILSFNGNKIITSGGGGALICPDEQTRQKALFYATQARDEAPHFEHSEIGFNYRLSNVLAALGNAQLNDLNQRVEKKRAIFALYLKAFKSLNKRVGEQLITSTVELQNSHSNRWLSTFLIKPHNSITAETWRLALEKAGIESRPLWKPMHLQPIFKQYPFYGDHTSDRIFEQGICLPSGTDLTQGQISEISEIIAALYP
jgi:dTDP-4-amino-4,6-dideoxygalactose transaminase